MEINTYDPLHAPNPEAWLLLDEADRVLLVAEYHKRMKVKLPNAHIHATFHTIIENQLAADDPPDAARALEKLISSGKDRHEAIHALGAILAEHLQAAMQNPETGTDPTAPYVRELRKL